ncbi:MAG: hypothetical protein V8S72_01210 [Oscillospiraceae bacterium]
MSTRSRPACARALGVDIDSLLISQPDTGEQALDIAESLAALQQRRRAGDRLSRRAHPPR